MSETCIKCSTICAPESFLKFGEDVVCVDCKDTYVQCLKEGVNPESINASSKEGMLFSELKWGSTWALAGLTIITLGIYLAHYVRRQTKTLNESLNHDTRISSALIGAIMGLTYLSVILCIPTFFLDSPGPLEKVIDVIDRVGNILFLIWAFKARNRMHMVLASEPKTEKWFGGLLTFLFGAFYFNYKVNKFNE